jgi:hypothetical protein
MAITDAKLSRVRVSTASAGTYAVIGYVRSFDMTEGSEGDSTTYYFGGEISRAGNPTITGTIPVFWDTEDTNGQTLIRTAKRNGTVVWLEFLPAGTGTGKPYERFEAIITEVSRSSAADGENVEGSFSFRGNASTLASGVLT